MEKVLNEGSEIMLVNRHDDKQDTQTSWSESRGGKTEESADDECDRNR